MLTHANVDQSVSIQCVFYLRLRCRGTPGDRAGGPGGRGHFCPVNCELQHATRTHTPATHTRSPCLKKEKKARLQTLLPTFQNKSTPRSERQAHRQHHVTLSGLFADSSSGPDVSKVWRTTQTDQAATITDTLRGPNASQTSFHDFRLHQLRSHQVKTPLFVRVSMLHSYLPRKSENMMTNIHLKNKHGGVHCPQFI